MIRVAAIMLLLSGAAEAAMYKCVVGGKTVYRDTPCAGTSREDNQVEIRGAAPAASTEQPAPAAPTDASASTATSNQEWLKQRDLVNRRNALKSQIAKLEKKGEGLRVMHNTRMRLLDIDASTANNNLAGSAYLQSIAAEKQALATTYEADMAANQSALDRANAELRELD